jgi:transposase
VFELAGVRVERIVEGAEAVTVEAAAVTPRATCPECGRASGRVHSRYVRSLRDLPACGRPVRVRLAVRRFRCGAARCARRTFVEQVAGATAPHRRTTARLEAALEAISAALGGEAGARLASRLGVEVGGDALLRLLRRARETPATPRVLGVDDWAWRRGRRWGSVLVDLEAGRPVDLLADRTAAALEAWLMQHPGVAVIVRDRSPEYARGAARGAPEAVQVLDRWHVLRNVREVAERLLDRHNRDLRRLAVDAPGTGAAPRRRSATEETRRTEVRRRASERHAEIQRLAAAGGTILGIARRLGVTRTMVRRYLFADAPPERDHPRRPSILDRHEPYLRRRWAEGARNALQLWRELRAQGYPGTSRQVSRWAEARRERDPAAPRRGRPPTLPAPAPDGAAPRRTRRPSVPRLAWLLVRDPGGLADDDLALLGRLQAACPPAATAYPLLQALVRMVKEQAPERLDGWLAAAAGSGVPDLVTFAAGLRRERAELLAALTLPWSNGQTEGQVTRLKLLKRQGYGRCGLDTLKRRFLHAA